jgi:5'-nucleotidase
MKLSMTLIALLGLTAAIAGCQDKKSSTSAATPSVTELSPTPVATATPAPAPSATVTPTQYASTGDVGPMTSSGTDWSATNGTASGSGSSTKYTVKHGDTLWKIASTHYGDGKQYKKILDANPGLTAANLKAGQTITLP